MEDGRPRRSRTLLKLYVAFSLVLGGLAGTATVYMALDHNPQQVYCDYVPKGQSGDITLDQGECNIVFGNLAPLVIVNAIFVSGVILLPVVVYVGTAALVRWLRRRVTSVAAGRTNTRDRPPQT